jgi:hypothetical protein
MMASEEAKGSFCRDDSCVVTNQLATDPGALERELLSLQTQGQVESGTSHSHQTR